MQKNGPIGISHLYIFILLASGFYFMRNVDSYGDCKSKFDNETCPAEQNNIVLLQQLSSDPQRCVVWCAENYLDSLYTNIPPKCDSASCSLARYVVLYFAQKLTSDKETVVELACDNEIQSAFKTYLSNQCFQEKHLQASYSAFFYIVSICSLIFTLLSFCSSHEHTSHNSNMAEERLLY